MGAAPFNRDSGAMRGKRMIFGGRASVRVVISFYPTLPDIRCSTLPLTLCCKTHSAGKGEEFPRTFVRSMIY